jgi:uncharacterized protein
MGRRERHASGTFCWVDLTTTDPAGAKTFYGELFGWEAEDMPAGEAGTYRLPAEVTGYRPPALS